MALDDIVVPEGDGQQGIVEINTGVSVSPSDITVGCEGVVEMPIKGGATSFAY